MENIQLFPGAAARAGISSLRSWLGDRKGNPRTLAGCCKALGALHSRAFGEFAPFSMVLPSSAGEQLLLPRTQLALGIFCMETKGARLPLCPYSCFPNGIHFTAFAGISSPEAQPLLQHPPQSQSQGNPHPQGFPKAAPASLLPVGMLRAFPQSLPASLHHPFATRKSLCLIMH